MDIFVPAAGHEPGEADLTYEETKRRARALFGDRAYIWTERKDGGQRFGIGCFVTDDRRFDDGREKPEIYRDWRLYGEGASFSEALRIAELRKASTVRRAPRIRRGRSRNARGQSNPE